MKKLSELLIGKKIVAIKGYAPKKQKAPAQFILLDDKETIIEFDVDVNYADASQTNRVSVLVDSGRWDAIMNSPDCFRDSDEDMFF